MVNQYIAVMKNQTHFQKKLGLIHLAQLLRRKEVISKLESLLLEIKGLEGRELSDNSNSWTVKF
jgi:hypothetical protein